MSTCYIVGAGEFTARGFTPGVDDFVIAADGGYLALRSIGVRPQLLLGDFDSLGSIAIPADVPVERFPVQKDDTDTGIALAHAWGMGYRSFAIYGGSGGRVDHLLANLQSMCRYSRLGGALRLAAREYDAYALTNGTLTLPKRPAGTLVSVFCNGDAASGVTLNGLMYPLHNHTLTCDMPLGVSNQMLDGEQASVIVQNGTLLVLQYLHSGEHPTDIPKEHPFS